MSNEPLAGKRLVKVTERKQKQQKFDSYPQKKCLSIEILLFLRFDFALYYTLWLTSKAAETSHEKNQ